MSIQVFTNLPTELLERIAIYVPEEMIVPTCRAMKEISKKAFFELYHIYRSIPEIRQCMPSYRYVERVMIKKEAATILSDFERISGAGYLSVSRIAPDQAIAITVLLTANRIFALGKLVEPNIAVDQTYLGSLNLQNFLNLVRTKIQEDARLKYPRTYASNSELAFQGNFVNGVVKQAVESGQSARLLPILLNLFPNITPQNMFRAVVVPYGNLEFIQYVLENYPPELNEPPALDKICPILKDAVEKNPNPKVALELIAYFTSNMDLTDPSCLDAMGDMLLLAAKKGSLPVVRALTNQMYPFIESGPPDYRIWFVKLLKLISIFARWNMDTHEHHPEIVIELQSFIEALQPKQDCVIS